MADGRGLVSVAGGCVREERETGPVLHRRQFERDGPEQPVVKDRLGSTGADTDTSATALHHPPLTGHEDYAFQRERESYFLSSL